MSVECSKSIPHLYLLSKYTKLVHTNTYYIIYNTLILISSSLVLAINHCWFQLTQQHTSYAPCYYIGWSVVSLSKSSNETNYANLIWIKTTWRLVSNDKNKNALCSLFSIYLFLFIFFITIYDAYSRITVQATIGETDQTLMIQQSVTRKSTGNQ